MVIGLSVYAAYFVVACIGRWFLGSKEALRVKSWHVLGCETLGLAWFLWTLGFIALPIRDKPSWVGSGGLVITAFTLIVSLTFLILARRRRA